MTALRTLWAVYALWCVGALCAGAILMAVSGKVRVGLRAMRDLALAGGLVVGFAALLVWASQR